MKTRNRLSALLVVVMLATSSVAMLACEKPKGPAEKAGEKLDKAVDKVSDAVDPKGPAEKAGRAIDRATDK
jgi:ABC-type oligopeptide transport system substrate-binding subunit